MIIKTLFMAGILTAISQAISAEPLVVVVHKDNPVNELTRSQLIDLYMGKYVAFPDGRKADPVDVANGENIREQFYRELVGLPLNRVNAYWSKIRFSGNARPPILQQNQQAALEYLGTSESAITYITASNVTSDVKVVYRFDQ